MAVEKTPEGEKKEVVEANQAIAKLRVPKGSEYIYNRLNKTFEKMWDGVPYVFEAHEQRLMTKELADFMYRTSVISYEPVTGVAVRALVTSEDPFFGLPYDEPLGPELLDRSVSDNYLGRGTDGVPTKAREVVVKGGGYDQGRKAGNTSRL